MQENKITANKSSSCPFLLATSRDFKCTTGFIFSSAAVIHRNLSMKLKNLDKLWLTATIKQGIMAACGTKHGCYL
jgi:hypothetical protein